MKTFTITAVAIAALTSLGLANPLEKRFDVSLTFYGPDGKTYGASIPTDGSRVDFSMRTFSNLVRSKILTKPNRQPHGGPQNHFSRRRILHPRWQERRVGCDLRRG